MSETLVVTNPASGDVISELTLIGEKELGEMTASAACAKKSWADTTIYHRSRIMDRFYSLMQEHAEELAQLMTAEMGKPIVQSRQEIASSIDIARSFTEKANHLYGKTLTTDNQPGYGRDLIFTRREPLGVIACIIPFNYPVKLYIHKVIPALLMGNVVLAKAPSSNPLAVLQVGRLLNEAGFPKDVMQTFVASRSASTKHLIEGPYVQGVSLTGSTAAGVEMSKGGAATLKHMFMELGGNDATIVRADADLPLAVGEILQGRMVNAGQTCCACKRILVQEEIADSFVSLMREKLSLLTQGDPLKESTDVGPLVTEKAARTVESQIKTTLDQGAELIAGGHRNGAFIEPTLFDQVTDEMDISRDMEVFGPVIPVIRYSTDEDAIRIANQSSYGLSSGIITEDLKKAISMAGQLEAGCTVLNGQGNYRHTEQGFGGVKMTGHSREGASATLEEFSKVKHFVIRSAFERES